MTGLTDALSAFVAQTTDKTIPERARSNAIDTIIDAAATTWAGRLEPAAAVIREASLPVAGHGGSVVLGEPATVDPATAALCNGAAAHALDYDSINFAVSGFAGSAMLAALSALADEIGVSGREFVTAYCLGWEVAAVLGRALNPGHYAKGWHPTSTLGLMAATAASSRLIGLDAERTTAALSVAVSEASGVKQMIGNMVNAYHVGKAARNAVTAVRLAQAGFAGHRDPLESEQGFLPLFAGPAGWHASTALASVGNVWDLLDPGPVFKVHACCGLIHSALDAVSCLMQDQRLTPDDIRCAEVWVHEYVPRVMHVASPPGSGYAAKFCMPYCVAAGIRDGRARLTAFTNVDPELVTLGRRVTVHVHPGLRGGDTFFEREFSEVRLDTAQGRFERRVERLHNRGSGGIDPPALEDKIAECFAWAGAGAPEATVELNRFRSIEACQRWETWQV